MTQLVGNVSAWSKLWTIDTMTEANVLKVGSEIVEVTARFYASTLAANDEVIPNQIRVRRGTNGTTAATHANGTALTPANAFADSGGEGGSDSRVTVDISAAQIRTLLASPVELIPRPGANKVIWPKRMFVVYTHVTTPYDAASLVPIYEGSGYGVLVESALSLSVLTETTYDAQPLASYPADDVVDKRDKALQLVAQTGNPGSSGDGTLRYIIDYEIVTL